MLRLLAYLLVWLSCLPLAAQTSIINDESKLRFFIGSFDEGIHTEEKVSGRHTMMTDTTQTDPFTDGQVKVVAPGSTMSYRLGNSRVRAQAERISYTMKITPETSLFVYQYAVVMEDPDHEPWEQPKFEITVTNQGDVFDKQCGYYKVVSAEHIPGFKSIGKIRYKDWTSVGVDLSPYMDQTVTIQFTTFDCQRGAHFGYSYFNAYYSKLDLKVKFCEGDEFAEIIAPPGFEYKWHPTGETTRRIKVSSKDIFKNYTCTITSVTGCALDLPTELVVRNAFIKVKAQTSKYPQGFNLSCHGSNDGTIDVQVKGGYPPYRIVWEDGSNDFKRSGLAAGNYKARVWDAVDCSKEVEVTLREPTPIGLDIYKTDVSCFGGADGKISVNLRGKNPAKYDFQWSHGATTQQVQDLPKGTYQVQVSSRQECSTVSVEITEPEEMIIAKEFAPVSCHGGSDGWINFEVSGGAPPYKFTWDRRGLTGSRADSLTAGVYEIAISDQNGCTFNHRVEITGPPAFNVDYSTSNYNGFEICCYGDANGSILIESVSGGQGPYQIEWPDGSRGSERGELKAGSYEIKIKDQKGCQTNLTINLRQPPHLRVTTNLQQTNLLLKVRQLRFRAQGGVPPYNYQVDKNGESFKSNSGDELVLYTTKGGAYQGAFVDLNGCEAKASKNIMQTVKTRRRRDKPNMYVKDICKPMQ